MKIGKDSTYFVILFEVINGSKLGGTVYPDKFWIKIIWYRTYNIIRSKSDWLLLDLKLVLRIIYIYRNSCQLPDVHSKAI